MDVVVEIYIILVNIYPKDRLIPLDTGQRLPIYSDMILTK